MLRTIEAYLPEIQSDLHMVAVVVQHAHVTEFACEVCTLHII